MDVVNVTQSSLRQIQMSFSWYDYTFFLLMLGMSAAIGVYFGFFGSKQSTANEYLLGGRKMKVIPIAVSLTASNISGITLLAVPTDVYRFGASYWLYCFNMITIYLITYYVYLPVFYKLQLTSTYEYLKLRFNGKIRILSSFLFTVSNLLYLPIVIYIPALALEQGMKLPMKYLILYNDPNIICPNLAATSLSVTMYFIWKQRDWLLPTWDILSLGHRTCCNRNNNANLKTVSATGINLHLITPLVCGVCIFYTTIGGLKAVVWTDTLQFAVMMGSIIGVFYMGILSVGGFGAMWQKSVEGKRLEIDFDLDPTKKDTFPAVIIGTLFGGLSYVAISQGFVQKYLSMPTMADVNKALQLFVIGMISIMSFSVITGLIMYARYADCDPFSAKKIFRQDEILPYYVMDVASTIPGLAGLFLSGIFSAALSTLSATMNCLAGSIYEDFVSPFMPKDISQKSVSNVLKLLVMIIGVISTALVFVIEKMGSILPIQFSLSGITSGPLFGLFTLGMLFPAANSKGALCGGVGSLAIMSVIVLGSQLSKANGFQYFPKPLSTEGCNITISTIADEPSNVEDDAFFLFKITYYYYTVMGTLLVILIGIPVSWLTAKRKDPLVSRDLISPISQWMIREEKEKGQYFDVTKALSMVTYADKK